MRIIVDILLEDFEDKRVTRKATVNKLIIFVEQESKAVRKHTLKKWLFIGIILGMSLIRIFESILPNV